MKIGLLVLLVNDVFVVKTVAENRSAEMLYQNLQTTLKTYENETVLLPCSADRKFHSSV